jgi:hypothetical protein
MAPPQHVAVLSCSLIADACKKSFADDDDAGPKVLPSSIRYSGMSFGQSSRWQRGRPPRRFDGSLRYWRQWIAPGPPILLPALPDQQK